jgi:hypothetical protein
MENAMKRILFCTMLALTFSVAGFFAGATITSAEGNEEPEQPATEEDEGEITDLEAWLSNHEPWVEGDMTQRLTILAELNRERRINRHAARGFQVRELLAYARANEHCPQTDLEGFVTWLGTINADRSHDWHAPTRQPGSVSALIETYGSLRLFEDEAFQGDDVVAQLERVKEAWGNRELAQNQSYDLTRQIVYTYLAQADGDIDRQIEMLGELHRANVMDWAAAAGIHLSLLIRGLSKPDLDTTEKRVAWLSKVADNRTGELSWMVASDRRVILLMEAADEQLGGMSKEEREQLIQSWRERGLVTSSDVNALKAAYSVP